MANKEQRGNREKCKPKKEKQKTKRSSGSRRCNPHHRPTQTPFVCSIISYELGPI